MCSVLQLQRSGGLDTLQDRLRATLALELSGLPAPTSEPPDPKWLSELPACSGHIPGPTWEKGVRSPAP